ncbi:MAG: gamma-glutamyl-phosphate reductase, partial [Gramella sp.]|nr:gamma-glutamyl-phosphate reductase [Christiangramia sp.]
MKLIKSELKNNVLKSMMNILDKRRNEIIEANKKDLEAFDRDDQAMYDRL